VAAGKRGRTDAGRTNVSPNAERADAGSPEFLSPVEVDAIVVRMIELLGPGIASRMRESGCDPRDSIRFHSVAARCTAARERLGASLKEAAGALKVPQYRLKAIEASQMLGRGGVDGDVLRRYAALLGLTKWLGQWRAQYPELASRILGSDDNAPRCKDPSMRRSAPQTDHGEVVVLDVELLEVRPRVWRRIEVPSTYTFYDLHVAMQDAMGWCDGHLNEFQVPDPTTHEDLRIGLPDDEGREVRAGWSVPIRAHLRRPKGSVRYLYDFGDGWEHRIRVVAVKPREAGNYPRCTGGARACPPEDVGGPGGFAHFLAALRDPDHEEHADMVEWSGGDYDPTAFDPRAVRFDDPEARRRMLLR
jgi:hypothetical protein